MLDINKLLVIYEISSLYLKTFKFFQLKPINYNILYHIKKNQGKQKSEYALHDIPFLTTLRIRLLQIRSVQLRIFKNI